MTGEPMTPEEVWERAGRSTTDQEAVAVIAEAIRDAENRAYQKATEVIRVIRAALNGTKT
jgi:hypothetical protein